VIPSPTDVISPVMGIDPWGDVVVAVGVPLVCETIRVIFPATYQVTIIGLGNVPTLNSIIFLRAD